MGLKGFERRLERLVEGTFAKTFRSGLQPVEVGRKITRALDDGRTVGVDGRAVAPNRVDVFVAPADFDRFETFADVLTRELADAARQHARDERYTFLGPVSVELVEDTKLSTGRFDVRATIEAGGSVGALILADESRVQLDEAPVAIGRLPECDITLSDPRVSRRHAEIQPAHGGWRVVDLGSMNGTTVNGVRVMDHELVDGDEVEVGSTVLRFVAS